MALTARLFGRSAPRPTLHGVATARATTTKKSWRKCTVWVAIATLSAYPLLSLYLQSTSSNADALTKLELQLRSRSNQTTRTPQKTKGDRVKTSSKKQLKQEQQPQEPTPRKPQLDTIEDKSTPPAVSEDAKTTTTTKKDADNEDHHLIAGLSCEMHGGPMSDTAENRAILEDMVYWKDIQRDAQFVSPLKHPTEEQFLTLEPDEGGWNNIRMAMETAIGLAIVTGRTLVLPPKMHMYRLWDGGSPDQNELSFSDFFHVDSVVHEHVGLKVLPFEDFLHQYAMQGKLLNKTTGLPSFPPNNLTDWSGSIRNFESTRGGTGKPLWEWMRNVTRPLNWTFDQCVVGLPQERGAEAVERVRGYLQSAKERDQRLGHSTWAARWESYRGHPTPVDANATERLAELLAHRNELCMYDEELQNAPFVHAIGETSTGFRLLVHFYAFLFFEDYHHDLWLKRFIRDHFRYKDEIQCAAARIVAAVRAINGTYDSFHVRRGDFQYKDMHLSAEEIYNLNTKQVLGEGRTVYVATDEHNKTFFDPLREHYHLVFLDDYMHLVKDLSPNYYGMLDQLVASRGDVFFGSFMSTFTGFINRMRGYQRNENGGIQSYYYVPPSKRQFRNIMRNYSAVRSAFWMQEFPISWRDIDHDVVAENTARRRRRMG